MNAKKREEALVMQQDKFACNIIEYPMYVKMKSETKYMLFEPSNMKRETFKENYKFIHGSIKNL